MLIDQLRQKRVRHLLQAGAIVVVAAMVLVRLADVGPVVAAGVELLVGLLLLVAVKGLLVVAVATRPARAEREASQPAGDQTALDPREVRELHELLARFFDEDPSVSGKVERLARLVEPVVATDSVREQELLALRERIERLERLGGS